MKKKLLAIVAVGTMFGPMAAHAVIVGDREWRQVTDTVGLTWNQIATVCDTATGACSGSLGGISFDGWNWADNDAVLSMFDELILPGSMQFPGVPALFFDPTGTLISVLISPDVFLPTQLDDRFRLIRGWTRSRDDFDDFGFIAHLVDWLDDGTDNAGLEQLGNANLSFPDVGAWLYRDVVRVAEPGTLAWFGLGLTGLALARRRRAS